MDSYKDEKLKRTLIMKHYAHPLHKVSVVPEWKNTKLHSQNCVDNLELALKIADNKILDVKFSGEGCAIFLASCDIFLDKIKNQSLNHAQEIAQNYERLITKKIANEKTLEELNIFANVKTHLNRLECAWLIKKAFDKNIE